MYPTNTGKKWNGKGLEREFIAIFVKKFHRMTCTLQRCNQGKRQHNDDENLTAW